MKTEELANYIEKLRYGRNISQEAFLEEIISLRQYQRYRSGQSIMPIEIAEQLANKLSVSIEKLLYEFEEDKNVEAAFVKDYYNSVASMDVKKIDQLVEYFKNYVFIDDEKKLVFDSARLIYDYRMRKISKIELVKFLVKLINYPSILNNDVLTDSEILVLSIILEFSETERDQIIGKLTAIFNKSNVLVSGSNFYAYTHVIYSIAKYYGRTDEYNEVIRFCDLGIKYNLENQTMYLLERFYYYKALVFFRRDKYEEFEKNLYQCILLLETELAKESRESFYQMIRRDFNINVYEFLNQLSKKKIIQHFE